MTERISGYPVVYFNKLVSGDVQQVAGFEVYAIYLNSKIFQILIKYNSIYWISVSTFILTP